MSPTQNDGSALSPYSHARRAIDLFKDEMKIQSLDECKREGGELGQHAE